MKLLCALLVYYAMADCVKDAWSPYIAAERTRLADWATGTFWDKNSGFTKEHSEALPKYALCDDMRRLIDSRLGQANQLGDGAALVWLWKHDCWNGVERRRAVWQGKFPIFEEVKSDEAADVSDIPKSNTNLGVSREKFSHFFAQPNLFPPQK